MNAIVRSASPVIIVLMPLYAAVSKFGMPARLVPTLAKGPPNAVSALVIAPKPNVNAAAAPVTLTTVITVCLTDGSRLLNAASAEVMALENAVSAGKTALPN